MKKFALCFALVALLNACDQRATEHNVASVAPQEQPPTAPSQTTDDPHDLKALAQALSQSDDTPQTPIKPIITKDGKTQIDWSLIDTKQPKADTANYAYPIAQDSQAVQNYANEYHITPAQAQHSIVIGMASPEALGKVLDQLTGKYLGHHLTDGADMTLVIETTADVVPQRHDYVFADKFGQGLVIPVVIEPKVNKK